MDWTKRITTILLLFLTLFIIAPTASEADDERLNPKLANYFLRWTIEDYEVEELARWDLLILDMEVQENSRANLERIRSLNPDIIILAYITSEEANADIYNSEWQMNATLRKRLVDQVESSYWLKDGSGQRISFWPGTYMFNLSANTGFNQFLPRFVSENIYSTGLWDGIYYDNLWGDVTWVKGDIDINNDGRTESAATVNSQWANGVKSMLDLSRRLMGNDVILMGNGLIYDGYQPYLNGMLMENFPSPWENGGTWSGSMKSYYRIAKYNRTPQLAVINSYSGDRNNFQKMRFALTSAMLRDGGYFSYDYNNTDHGQLWWYDEYDVDLGRALYPAYNLLDRENDTFKPGLWRKDFENGLVLVNSTNQAQRYVFGFEEVEKINGSQDGTVNDGTKVNWVKVNPNDGIILLKRKTEIKNSRFYNGYFVRSFNNQGEQTQNGFFSYLDSLPGQSQIHIADIDSDGQEEMVSNYQNQISIYRQGQKIKSFAPINKSTKEQISMAVADLDNNGQAEILVGAFKGYAPQVQIFNTQGKLLGVFLAYDKNFKGGVNIASADMDGDGQKDIITGAGTGGGPEVRVFDKRGKMLNKFMAYDKRFKGGVYVASADVDGDGKNEIVTSPGATGGPHIKIFNLQGKIKSQFMAYDNTYTKGVKVLTEDLDNNGVFEILATIPNF
ncbi:MAG TPA: putative glycoside hydrolase [bacterium]|nr:putative glycoside hydrolase [bacterium]HPT29572.1 putative glycoside hydrolase [bacterium]